MLKPTRTNEHHSLSCGSALPLARKSLGRIYSRSSVNKEYDLKSLDDQLEAAIEKEGAGEFDGHEFGSKNVTIFLYVPDAETLFQTVEPVLRQYPLCRRASVTIRQGTGERQVVI